MSKLENIFSATIVFILLSSSAYSLFIKEQEVVSQIEKRNLTTTDHLLDKSILSGAFRDGLESVLADQFYERLFFVSTKSQLNFNFGDTIYQFTDNPFVLNRIGDTAVYQIGQTDYLMALPIQYEQAIEDRILQRIEQINILAQDYPDVDVFVYKPTQIKETNFFDEANGLSSAGQIYENLFIDNLEVPYASLKIHTFEDYLKYFYYTDHHWNHVGIQQGYVDIIQLMFKTTDNVLIPWGENCKEDLRFYGTLSTITGQVTQPAPFCVYGYEMPNYTLIYEGQEMPYHYDTNNFYFADVISRNGYHYNDAYDLILEPLTLLELTMPTPQQENILVIGDSYAPAVLPLLANHFNHIYYVNPITYQQVYDKDFAYDSFIQEHNIQNILYMVILDNYHVADEWGERYTAFDIVRD